MELKLIHSCNIADEISKITFLYRFEKEYGSSENVKILNNYLNELISAQIDGYCIYRPDDVDRICKRS